MCLPQEVCINEPWPNNYHTKQLTYSLATTNNVSIQANWHQNEKASHDGLNFFMKRNPTLSVRKPEHSQARAAAFNKPVVM